MCTEGEGDPTGRGRDKQIPSTRRRLSPGNHHESSFLFCRARPSLPARDTRAAAFERHRFGQGHLLSGDVPLGTGSKRHTIRQIEMMLQCISPGGIWRCSLGTLSRYLPTRPAIILYRHVFDLRPDSRIRALIFRHHLILSSNSV